MALARTRKKLKKAAHKAKPKKVEQPILGLADSAHNASDKIVRVSELADFKEFYDGLFIPIKTRVDSITPKAMIFSLEDGTTETWHVDTESQSNKKDKK